MFANTGGVLISIILFCVVLFAFFALALYPVLRNTANRSTLAHMSEHSEESRLPSEPESEEQRELRKQLEAYHQIVGAMPPKPPEPSIGEILNLKTPEPERPRESFTDGDRDFPMPHESRSFHTGAPRKTTTLSFTPDSLPGASNPPKPEGETKPKEPYRLIDNMVEDVKRKAYGSTPEQKPEPERPENPHSLVSRIMYGDPDLQRRQEEENLRKREELIAREESLEAQRRTDRVVDVTRNPRSASEVMDDFARQAELDRREKLIEREEALRQSQPIGAYASAFKADETKQPPAGNDKRTGNSFGWLALGFALVQKGLDVIGFKNLIVGALLFLGAFVAFVFWFVGWERARQWRFSKRALIVSLAALVYFPLVGYQLYAQYKSEHPEKPQTAITATAPALTPSQTPTAVTPSKTLHDYFSEQGGNCWRETIEREVTVKKRKLKVEAQMCMDFNKKAQHLAFYIPDTVTSNGTFEVCSRLIDTHEGIIRDFIRRFQGTMETGPIEGRQTQVKDLRFTKYLVFFHEWYITQDRLDWLDLQARRKGLIVEFHSQRYVMARTPK